MTGTAKKFNFGKYYREIKSEINKVSWPSFKELVQHTEVVLTSIVIIGLFLAGVDAVFGKAVGLFLSK